MCYFFSNLLEEEWGRKKGYKTNRITKKKERKGGTKKKGYKTSRIAKKKNEKEGKRKSQRWKSKEDRKESKKKWFVFRFFSLFGFNIFLIHRVFSSVFFFLHFLIFFFLPGYHLAFTFSKDTGLVTSKQVTKISVWG